jgi:hypothetical protein
MQLKKWQRGLIYIGIFAVWFAILNLVPFIPIERQTALFPQNVTCSLNYWSCFNTAIDVDTFPSFLKKDIFVLFLLPFFFPLALTWATSHFLSKKIDK